MTTKVTKSAQNAITPFGAYKIYSGTVTIPIRHDGLAKRRVKAYSEDELPHVDGDYICVVPQVPTSIKSSYDQRTGLAPDHLCMGEFTRISRKGVDVTPLFFNIDEAPLLDTLYRYYPNHLFSGKYTTPGQDQAIPVSASEIPVHVSFCGSLGRSTEGIAQSSVQSAQIQLKGKCIRVEAPSASPLSDELIGFICEQVWIDGRPVFNSKTFTRQYQCDLWISIQEWGYQDAHDLYQDVKKKQKTLPEETDLVELDYRQAKDKFKWVLPLPVYSAC